MLIGPIALLLLLPDEIDLQSRPGDWFSTSHGRWSVGGKLSTSYQSSILQTSLPQGDITLNEFKISLSPTVGYFFGPSAEFEVAGAVLIDYHITYTYNTAPLPPTVPDKGEVSFGLGVGFHYNAAVANNVSIYFGPTAAVLTINNYGGFGNTDFSDLLYIVGLDLGVRIFVSRSVSFDFTNQLTWGFGQDNSKHAQHILSDAVSLGVSLYIGAE